MSFTVAEIASLSHEGYGQQWFRKHFVKKPKCLITAVLFFRFVYVGRYLMDIQM